MCEFNKLSPLSNSDESQRDTTCPQTHNIKGSARKSIIKDDVKYETQAERGKDGCTLAILKTFCAVKSMAYHL